MIHFIRLLGDFLHVASVGIFLGLLGWRGNAAGISLKSQQLFLLTFVMRYLDFFTSFYNWYNTTMKLFFLGTSATAVYLLMKVEPAKSTYSPAHDSLDQWRLIGSAGIVGLVIHLIGSGVVDIKGSSGQEFEVHLEHYSWLSFLWTFSICLEPLAMLPQLYMFRKNRRMSWELRLAIASMGTYRICYFVYWILRVFTYEDFNHHYLLYLSGTIQVLTYTDFFLYHFSVAMLWLISKYGGEDSSAIIQDSGIHQWATQAQSNQNQDELDIEAESLMKEVQLTGKSPLKRTPKKKKPKVGLI